MDRARSRSSTSTASGRPMRRSIVSCMAAPGAQTGPPITLSWPAPSPPPAPISHKLHSPRIVDDGTFEPPEFQPQTRDFCAAVRAAGKPVEMLVGEGYNHCEMLETLANPYGLLGRAVFAQMELTL